MSDFAFHRRPRSRFCDAVDLAAKKSIDASNRLIYILVCGHAGSMCIGKSECGVANVSAQVSMV